MRLPEIALALTLVLPAAPVLAGTPTVVRDHILPGTAEFVTATEALAEAAQADCTADAMKGPYNDAFDSWLGISHLRFGPLEVDGRVNAIAFWPDPKGFVGRSIAGLIADEDPIVEHPEDFDTVSVAARGFFALEELLYEDQFAGYTAGSYTCSLVQAISTGMAEMAQDIDTEWREVQAPLMLSAGEPDNTAYLSKDEATQALYTSLLAGLEFTADQRLGRPLGTFDRPRARRAEARRSGRSLRNVQLSLAALREFSETLSDVNLDVTEAAFDEAQEQAATLGDPVFAGVDDPTGRLKVEILQQRVQAVRRAVEGEIGASLGVTAGFNSADGD